MINLLANPTAEEMIDRPISVTRMEDSETELFVIKIGNSGYWGLSYDRLIKLACAINEPLIEFVSPEALVDLMEDGMYVVPKINDEKWAVIIPAACGSCAIVDISESEAKCLYDHILECLLHSDDDEGVEE